MSVFLPLGLIYFCAAGIGSSVISVFINSWYTGKIYNFGFAKQMKDILPILLLSLTMFVITLFVISCLNNMWIQLIIGSMIGVVVYLGGAVLFRFEELKEVMYMLNLRRK